MREVRRAAIQAQKNCKETLPRARRLTKEMMLYWKKYDKVEKEHRKRAEKEALEQRKLDEEMREVCDKEVIMETFLICHYRFFENPKYRYIFLPGFFFFFLTLSGQASAAQTEFSHYPDGALCSFYEW